MLFFTNESVLIDYGVSYLRIAGFSCLLTGIYQCYLVIMKTSEHARTTATISSATVCHNIILNAVFIYGAFGILGACLFWGIGFISYSSFMGHLGVDAAAVF